MLQLQCDNGFPHPSSTTAIPAMDYVVSAQIVRGDVDQSVDSVSDNVTLNVTLREVSLPALITAMYVCTLRPTFPN